jgi:hypothetical protein
MGTRAGYFMFTLSFLFLAFLLPLLFYLDIRPKIFTLNIGLCWFILVFSGFRLVSPMIRNRERLLEMSFWLFGYVFMGIVPFVQIMGNHFPWYGIYEADRITQGLLIILLGMISYQVGLSMRISLKRQTEHAALEHPFVFGNRAFVLVSILSLAITWIGLMSTNGLHLLFLPRNEMLGANSEDNKSLGLVMEQLTRVPLFVCLVVGIVMWKKKKLTKIYAYLTVIVLLLNNVIVNNPISNARYWVGSVMLTLCLLLIPWKKGSFLGWCIGYLLLFLIIFPYADLFRNELNPTITYYKVSEIIRENGDYDAFQMVMNTSKVVDLQGGTLHGLQLLGAFLFWVPRSVWPDKPLSSGQFVGETLGYPFTNFSCPLWGESYLNFGYAGVIIIFLAYGCITRVLQRRYIKSKFAENMTVTQILVPFLSAYQIFLLRGDLMNGIAYLSGFLLFTYIFSAKKERNKRASLSGLRGFNKYGSQLEG